MMFTLLRKLCALGLICVMVTACQITGFDRSKPVGTEGFGPETFPKSPCACVELKQPEVTPAYLEQLRRRLG